MATTRIPIACNLDAGEARSQLARWRYLRRHLVRTAWTATGAVLWFERDAKDAVEEVARIEQECCPFLTLSAAEGEGDVRLEISSGDPDAFGVIEVLVDNAGGFHAPV